MAAFDHLLLTRFNVRTSAPRSPFVRGLDPGWLENRLDLFERFCLPSVRAQTNPRFVWLVFFDEATPEPFRQRIGKCRSQVEFQPVYLPGFEIGAVRASLRPFLSPDNPCLITSRLDNDDAICRTFIGDVQAELGGLEQGLINFDRGYIWSDGRVYSHENGSNAFISMIERKTDNLRTVFEREHSKFPGDPRLRRSKSAPAWLQTVHGDNISNTVRGRRVSREAFQRENRFAINPGEPAVAESVLGIWIERWRTWPLLPRWVAKVGRWLRAKGVKG